MPSHGHAHRGGKHRAIRERRPLALWQETLLLTGIAVAIAILVKVFLVQPFTVPSSSMEQTLRIGDRILVSGTTAIAGLSQAVAPADAGAQTTYILDRIVASVVSLGGRVEDIARTRIYITDEADVLAISRAHGRVLGDIKPANTLVRVAGLIGDHRVEIEAEAIVRAATSHR